MNEKMEKIKKSIDDLKKIIDDTEKKIDIGGVKPKFSVEQKVYRINKDKVPSWYKMPVLVENIKDGFEVLEIERIIISRGRNLSYKGCAIENTADNIMIGYGFGLYENSCTPEKWLWGSLEEAIAENKNEFAKEKVKYLTEIEKEKEEKRKRLENEIKNL